MGDQLYDFSDLKYFSKEKLDQILNVFHCVKIPVTTKESEFLYFRRYPVEKLGPAPVEEKRDKKELDLNLPKTSFSKPQVIVYENPFAKKKLSEKEKIDENSKKMLGALPEGRTLLVVSMDKKFSEEEIKEIFSFNGKVRRVFYMNMSKKMDQKKRIQTKHFYVLIYKHEKSLLQTFDVKHFHWLLLQNRLKSFYRMSDIEKDNFFEEYYKTIKDHLHQEEEEVSLEEGTYVGRKHETTFQDIFDQYKRKKKQKDKVHENYYQFSAYHQMGEAKTKKQKASLPVKFPDEPLDEEKLENPDYIQHRKEKLARDFQSLKKFKDN